MTLNTRAGFTLVEMITVLLALTLMTAIAMPKIHLSRARADGAALEVMSSIMAAQSKALLRQHNVMVQFDTAGSRIIIVEDEDNDGLIDGGELATVVTIPGGVRLTRSTAPAHPLGTAAVSFAIGPGNLPTLTFHRNGSASEAGVVYLTPAAPGGGSEPAMARALTIERSTGQVRCLAHDSSSWGRSC